jgi:hypothetical protein
VEMSIVIWLLSEDSYLVTVGKMVMFD